MKIFVYDEFGPEDTAMMQALYSRSALSVEEHVKKVKASGSGKFMERFYVGYGHASIADCGSATVFIEDVSMLVAKAVQDWSLYSGQETSSRYIDLSKREIKDPVNTEASKKILERWMKFYTESQPAVESHLKEKYKRKPEEDEKIYDKAIKARVFDIMRGFLPAGITTQLSWHTNLRQAHDKLDLLKHHPLIEVREVAEKILSSLRSRYTNSFGHPIFEDQENYREFLGKEYTYFSEKAYDGDFSFKTNIKNSELEKYLYILEKRPIKTGLPSFLSELGNITFDFLLDFGSFRDIQRHRNGVCRMPLLTTGFGFNDWYLEQLPADVKAEAEKLIKEQIAEISKLNCRSEDLQYYIAMGFNVSCRVSYGLPACVYVVELRSGIMVHPTLRKVAHNMDKALRTMFPKLLLHSDLNLDDWDMRRGTQDIKER